jgi:hypothetical protein
LKIEINFWKITRFSENLGNVPKFTDVWENLGKNLEEFGNIWKFLGNGYLGDISVSEESRDCAPARYFSHGARNITGGRSLCSDIMYYNSVSRGHCAIIERFQVITRRLTRWMRAAGYKQTDQMDAGRRLQTQLDLETDHQSRQ